MFKPSPIAALALLSALALLTSGTPTKSLEEFRKVSAFCGQFDSEHTICEFCCSHFDFTVAMFNRFGEECTCGHEIDLGDKKLSEEQFANIINKLANTPRLERRLTLLTTLGALQQ